MPATPSLSPVPAATMTAATMARRLARAERDLYRAEHTLKAVQAARDFHLTTIEELRVELEETRVRLADREAELAAQWPLLVEYRMVARLTRAMVTTMAGWHLNPDVAPGPVLGAIREYLCKVEAMEGRVIVRRPEVPMADGATADRLAPSELVGSPTAAEPAATAGTAGGEPVPAASVGTGGEGGVREIPEI